jgi:hypothetical protein
VQAGRNACREILYALKHGRRRRQSSPWRRGFLILAARNDEGDPDRSEHGDGNEWSEATEGHAGRESSWA